MARITFGGDIITFGGDAISFGQPDGAVSNPNIPTLQAGTKNFHRNDFNMEGGEELTLGLIGAGRHDISVEGSVDVVIGGSVKKTLTDSTTNLIYGGEFKLKSVGASSGSVISFKRVR